MQQAYCILFTHKGCYSVRKYCQTREHKNLFIRKIQGSYNPNQQILTKPKDGEFIDDISEFSLNEKVERHCFKKAAFTQTKLLTLLSGTLIAIKNRNFQADPAFVVL